MSITERTRAQLYLRDNGICGICGRPIESEDFDIDHIKPKSKGGSDDESNLRVAHGHCNSVRNDGEFREWPEPDGTNQLDIAIKIELRRLVEEYGVTKVARKIGCSRDEIYRLIRNERGLVTDVFAKFLATYPTVRAIIASCDDTSEVA